MKKYVLFIILTLLLFCYSGAEILITEVSPPGINTSSWLEIQNVGDNAQSIKDWKLVKMGTNNTFTDVLTLPDITMQPGETAWIQPFFFDYNDTEINQMIYGTWDIWFTSLSLSSLFDNFILLDSSGVIKDSVIYRSVEYTEYDTMTLIVKNMVNSGAWTVTDEEKKLIDQGVFAPTSIVPIKKEYGLRRKTKYTSMSTADWEPVKFVDLTPGQDNLQTFTEDIQLFQNYPNPFYPKLHDFTVIQFYTKGANPVSLRIYDLLGNLIKVLVNNETLSPGFHKVLWNGTNDKDKKVGSGTFLIVLKYGNFSIIKKMTIIR